MRAGAAGVPRGGRQRRRRACSAGRFGAGAGSGFSLPPRAARRCGEGPVGAACPPGLSLARLGGSAGRARGSARCGEPADPPFSASLPAVAWQAPSASGSRAAPPPRTGPLLAGRHHADLPEGEAGGILAEREEDQETEFPGLRRAVPVRRRPSPQGAPGRPLGQAAAPGWGWDRSCSAVARAALGRTALSAWLRGAGCARRDRGRRARTAPGTPPLPPGRARCSCVPLTWALPVAPGKLSGMVQRPCGCARARHSLTLLPAWVHFCPVLPERSLVFPLK